MKRWQAVVFDLDDTLYPERAYVQSGMRAVADWAASELHVSADDAFQELWRLFESGVRGDTFNRWVQSRNLDTERWVPEMVRVYRDHQPSIEPFPEVVELLGWLQDRVDLGLVSDGWHAAQNRKLKALGLCACFDAVVFTDSIGRDAWKPSPRGFEVLFGKMSVPARSAVYVADNPTKDFRAARSAGIGSIRLRHAKGVYCHLEPKTDADAPDWEVTDFPSLHEFFRESVALGAAKGTGQSSVNESLDGID